MMSANRMSFRVGLNEGIVILRSKLSEIELYTDGLRGCLALVVANSKYVFMAHVSSGSDSDTMKDRAGKYLKKIIGQISENKGGFVQVGFGASIDSDSSTINAFLHAWSGKHLVCDSGCCSVEFDHSGKMRLIGMAVRREPYNIVGTLKRPDLIVRRIDADSYGFGSQVLEGGYDEMLDVVVRNEDWKKSPGLLRAVEDLVRVASQQRGKISYGYVGELLNIVDEKILANGLTVTEQHRIKICHGVVEFLLSMRNSFVNVDEKINAIVVNATTSPCISLFPSWIPTEVRYKKLQERSTSPQSHSPKDENLERLTVIGKGIGLQ